MVHISQKHYLSSFLLSCVKLARPWRQTKRDCIWSRNHWSITKAASVSLRAEFSARTYTQKNNTFKIVSIQEDTIPISWGLGEMLPPKPLDEAKADNAGVTICPASRSIFIRSLACFAFSWVKNVNAVPFAPARPVRPILWT